MNDDLSVYSDRIKNALASNGPEALTNLPALAFAFEVLEGFDPADPQTLLERSVKVYPVVHPLVEAQLELSGATRRGRYTWSIGLGDDSDPAPLGMLARILAANVMQPKNFLVTPQGLPSVFLTYSKSWYRQRKMQEMLTRAPQLWQVYSPYARPIRGNHCQGGSSPQIGPTSVGVVGISVDNINCYMQFFTTPKLDLSSGSTLKDFEMNIRLPGRTAREPKAMLPAEAIALIESLQDWANNDEQKITIVDDSATDAFNLIKANLRAHLVVWPTSGSPAKAFLSVGRDVPEGLASQLNFQPFKDEAQNKPNSLKLGPISAKKFEVLARQYPEVPVVIHPAVVDVGRMALATPVGDASLREYQREAVGLHLSTDFGFVNAVETGMGKTVTTLYAMKERSKIILGWRGLVGVEANTRDQWDKAVEVWFPNCRRVIIEKRSDSVKLATALAQAGSEPVIVVCSYSLLATAANELDVETTGSEVAAPATILPLVKSVVIDENGQYAMFDSELQVLSRLLDTAVNVLPDAQSQETDLGTLLLSVKWNDLAADEAVCLKNTGSKQAKAMWKIRANSDVAVVLTATPITRDLDDLGRLLSFVRNDSEMFLRNRLAKRFPNLDDPDVMDDFKDSLGPLVFRRSKELIMHELPQTNAPETIILTPTPEEMALAMAARHELKRVYHELLAWIEMVERTDPGNPAYEEAKVQLKIARGAWLGGTTLARMAASDPAVLLASNSAGAALLAGQGLIAAATQQRGTKRAWAIDAVEKAVREGEKILLFTAFSTVAEGLLADLAEIGIRAGGILGGGGKLRDCNRIAFTKGDLDVLICTSAGERGMNLQTASMIIHYDLPWTPDAITQRMGRLIRIGATAERIRILFPIMAGTVEEHIASTVATRAVTSMLALDVSRGANVSNTDMGRAVAGLVQTQNGNGVVQDPPSGSKQSLLLTITRELVG